jgi:hypothetical protein
VIAGALCAAVAVSAPARAEKAPRLGIAVSLAVNLPPGEADHVAERLGKALRKHLVVDTIAGAEARRRLPADGISESCVNEPACLQDVAQRLAADELLFLAVVKVGSRIQVDATWIDPTTGRAVPRPAVAIEERDQAEARFGEVASQILPDAAVRPAATGEGPGGPGFVEQRRPRRMTTGAWVSAGVGGAFLAGAVGFTLAARSDYRSCDRSGDCTEGELDTLERKALAADLLWGGAALGLVATGVFYWMSGGDLERVPAEGAAMVRLGPAPAGSIGLSLEGAL